MHLLIGHLARRCGLSASALRFYDECDLLKPSHVDPQTGYRCYDEDQVETAVLIPCTCSCRSSRTAELTA